MNSLRSTGSLSMKIIESLSTRAFQTATKGDTVFRHSNSNFHIPSVRQTLASPRSIVGKVHHSNYVSYRTFSSLKSQPFTNIRTTSMMTSTVARRFASRASQRVCFSTAARSQNPRPLTPLLAAAGVAALSIAIATQEVSGNKIGYEGSRTLELCRTTRTHNVRLHPLVATDE